VTQTNQTALEVDVTAHANRRRQRIHGLDQVPRLLQCLCDLERARGG
jgi:hypothetical protein